MLKKIIVSFLIGLSTGTLGSYVFFTLNNYSIDNKTDNTNTFVAKYSNTRNYQISKKVSVYMPWWVEEKAFVSLVKNQNFIYTIHPFWYKLKINGEIETFNGINQDIIDFSKANNILIIPSISNDFDAGLVRTVLSSPVLRAEHIKEIQQLVIDNNFDGIDIDYEGLELYDREIFSTFIQELAQILHANNKLLTVAVHAKTSDEGTWGGPASQDWTVLNSFADSITIMTYDYHWSTSAAGDIAPIDWVNDVIEYALTRIDRNKIQLGIHFYGYDWVADSAESLLYEDVQEIISQYSITQIEVSEQGEKYFQYKNLNDHTVYYADYEVVLERLELVKNNNLNGISIWSIGGEDSRIWTESISTL